MKWRYSRCPAFPASVITAASLCGTIPPLALSKDHEDRLPAHQSHLRDSLCNAHCRQQSLELPSLTWANRARRSRRGRVGPLLHVGADSRPHSRFHAYLPFLFFDSAHPRIPKSPCGTVGRLTGGSRARAHSSTQPLASAALLLQLQQGGVLD